MKMVYQKSWTAKELINELSIFKEDLPIYLNVGYQHYPTIGLYRGRIIISFGSEEFRLKTVGAFIEKLKTLQENTILFTLVKNDNYSDDTDWGLELFNDGFTLFKGFNVIVGDDSYIVLGGDT